MRLHGPQLQSGCVTRSAGSRFIQFARGPHEGQAVVSRRSVFLALRQSPPFILPLLHYLPPRSPILSVPFSSKQRSSFSYFLSLFLFYSLPQLKRKNDWRLRCFFSLSVCLFFCLSLTSTKSSIYPLSLSVLILFISFCIYIFLFLDSSPSLQLGRLSLYHNT